jgi:YD repeat-containing protein
VTDPLDQETTFTYDGAGQLLTATDPLSQTTTFGYEVADLVAITDPLGRRRRASWMPPGGCCRCATRSAAQPAIPTTRSIA